MSQSGAKIHRVPSVSGHTRLDKNDILNQLRLLPNLITIFRVILIIPIFILYSNPSPGILWVVVSLIIISYLTDFADGFFARKLAQQSKLGMILDPVADKIWTLVMIYLLFRYRDLSLWIMSIIIIRDVGIVSINIHVFVRTGSVMPSDEFGRKYLVLMGLMVIGYTLRIPYIHWLAYLIVILVMITGSRYYIEYRKRMHNYDPSFVKSK